MNKNIVLSLSEQKIYGAWVYRVDLEPGGVFNKNECVWLLSSNQISSYELATFYQDEYVHIETLILHAMYAWNADFK